jgi:transposase
MLDEETRAAILKLRERGHGIRPIARTLRISRQVVRGVVQAGSATAPALARAEAPEPFRDEILAQHASCKGNLVRVHEELVERGAKFSYAALTAFCRKHGIGHSPREPDGRYEFKPGQEMQHDTSPHVAIIGGKERRVQSASLVACYSHLLYFQLYPRFTRFECKIFLTDGILYQGGSCAKCMIDNTSVIRLYGTGAEMVPVPEMAAFAERFNFKFIAHELKDPNRKGRVEAPMPYIEDNFYAGRTFADFEDANRQAAAWCDKVNATFNRRWHASRRELFRAEQPKLQPLPIWIPQVYELHQRTVDTDGFINLHRNRYSVPYKLDLIGRELEVRELKDRVEIYYGPRQVASHRRVVESCDARVIAPEHRPPRGEGCKRRGPSPYEEQLLKVEPRLGDYVAALRRKVAGRGGASLRRLLRMLRDYPREPFLAAAATALEYGLFDLDRLERLVLRHVGRDYFVLPSQDDDPEEDDEEE